MQQWNRGSLGEKLSGRRAVGSLSRWDSNLGKKTFLKEQVRYKSSLKELEITAGTALRTGEYLLTDVHLYS